MSFGQNISRQEIENFLLKSEVSLMGLIAQTNQNDLQTVQIFDRFTGENANAYRHKQGKTNYKAEGTGGIEIRKK